MLFCYQLADQLVSHMILSSNSLFEISMGPSLLIPIFRPWGYLAIYNLLDYPAVTIPITHVDKEIDYADVGYKPVSDADKKNHDLYDPDLFHGMPVAVQLVGLPLMEEELLDVASVLDLAVRGTL
jgi:hypothetical protein